MNMKQRIKKILLIYTAAAAVGILYAVFMKITGVGIPCPIYKLFGIKCPGCGMSRFMLSCMQLKFKEAMNYNAAGFFILAYILFAAAILGYRYIIKDTRAFDRLLTAVSIIAGVLGVVWWTLRLMYGI